MKTASDYDITYPYAATSPPYSPQHPHLGDDRSTPTGTRFEVLGVLLGLSGSTGKSTGPHTHVAKWKPGKHPGGIYIKLYDRTYFKPSDVWKAEGRVTETGQKPVAGKYVRWLSKGFTYEVFHLSVIQAKLGQVIKGVPMEEKVSNKLYNELKRLYHGEAPSRAQLDRYVGKITEAELRRKLKTSPKFKERIKQAEAGKLDPRDFLPIEIRQVYKDTRIQQFKDKITNLIKKA